MGPAPEETPNPWQLSPFPEFSGLFPRTHRLAAALYRALGTLGRGADPGAFLLPQLRVPVPLPSPVAHRSTPWALKSVTSFQPLQNS